MRQKAVASILNWRITKKNRLFSYALVARFCNFYWHHKLPVNQYLHIKNCFFFETQHLSKYTKGLAFKQSFEAAF